jgi:hypothetical protein
MKYHLTLRNPEGIMLEQTVDLPVEDSITWHDFTQLSKVKDLLLLNPSMTLWDVTPDGVPDRYTEEQILRITLQHQGLRKSQAQSGATVYQDLEEDA